MKSRKRGRFSSWLFREVEEIEGPHEPEGRHHEHEWWKVMCLTGVDYFSTLGYQPGIALLAAGALSPFATLVLVMLTMFGALPMYRRVAEESPHGDGSISMLEKLLSRWKGKMFVLMLLGFVATSFIITITLSAADATAHIVENPFVEHNLQFLNHKIIVTLILIGMLGAVFLKGFNEAIGIAVGIVAVYLALNFVTIGYAFYQISIHPDVLANWQAAVWAHPSVGGSLIWIFLASMFYFPKLALGLSGFETGVVVMPLVKSDVEAPHLDQLRLIHATRVDHGEIPDDAKAHLDGRIRNGKKLLTSAAVIMSFYLIGSSIVTTMLIPTDKIQQWPAARFRCRECRC